MKKLNLAIIGQGRSGKDIHGTYYRSEDNKYYNVRYVVDMDEGSRKRAEELYPGCKTFADYRELFNLKDIDVVVNAAYSDMHFSITKDLLEHKFNVMVDKPFSRTRYECEVLMKTARENGVKVAVFQQSFYAPYYREALKLIQSGVLGEIRQITLHYNFLKRRWDWQTLQKKVGGDVYNTGPHPIGLGLGFLGFDDKAKLAYSRIAVTPLTSGDAENHAKLLIEAPDKPLVDIEITSTDAYNNYTLKIQGDYGTFKTNTLSYDYIYIVPEENEPRPLVEETLRDADGQPVYCSDSLNFHEHSGKYEGTAFEVGTAGIYKDLYYYITEGKEMFATAEHAARVISIIEELHAANPLPVKF